MEDPSDHPGVRILGVLIVGVSAAALAFVAWFSEKHTAERDAWDIVPIGARCADLGVEERTFADKAAFCASFPRYGLQVWSLSRADVKAPTPAPLDPREAQIRVCMQQSKLDQRNCEAGIRQYEGSPG
jgi:serine/threonine-protein kinase